MGKLRRAADAVDRAADEVYTLARQVRTKGLDVELPSLNQFFEWWRDRDKPLKGLRIKPADEG